MKLTHRIISVLATTLVAVSCSQEPIIPVAEEPVVPETPSGTSGSANFSKFVAVGNSLTAGYQAGALFTEGQNNSLAAILAKQFSYAGGSATFNQPDIGSVNGFNTTTTNPPFTGGPILGRLVLFDPDGSGPRTAAPAALGTPQRVVTCPSEVTTPAVPGTGGDVPTAYGGNKAALNNFGVPGILLGQALTPLTGGPPTSNPAFNPLYARFASNPGTSTILGDALAAQGTFFMFFLGNNDILGYATTGASGAIPLTSEAAFEGQYNAAIGQILGSNSELKGVVGTIPDVTTIPFFFTVTYNAVTLSADQATALNGAFAGYNTVLDGIAGNAGLLSISGSTAANIQARKVSYTAGAGNRILIAEKTSDFPDLGSTFDQMVTASIITPAQRAALEPYRRVRQATANDLITLSAGGVLGTCLNPPGNNPQLIIGTTIPLADQYVLLPSETAEIRTRTIAFNNIIKAAAAGSGNRLAVADVNEAFAQFVTDRVRVVNGVTITPSFAPPTGGFSEDGVHPNSRGYAFLANIFIDAINAKFGATVPKANLANYKGTGLPLSPPN
ncbi:MAG: hypothetical protein KF775_12320 [Cyclobacteriaceae bacterium]|nr:hypothetical protein [Cyclobacteriaceae bacterium]